MKKVSEVRRILQGAYRSWFWDVALADIAASLVNWCTCSGGF